MMPRRCPLNAGYGSPVADRDEISALVYRYAELLDGGDLDGVTDMFADATWRSAATGAVLTTRDEVRAVYENVILYDGVAAHPPPDGQPDHRPASTAPTRRRPLLLHGVAGR